MFPTTSVVLRILYCTPLPHVTGQAFQSLHSVICVPAKPPHGPALQGSGATSRVVYDLEGSTYTVTFLAR